MASAFTNCADEDYKKEQLRVLNFPLKKRNFPTLHSYVEKQQLDIRKRQKQFYSIIKQIQRPNS